MIKVSGKVIKGHGVASGQGEDKTFPTGTIKMQAPFFKKLGLDLSDFFMGTLNISISPNKFKIIKPKWNFKNLAWTEIIPPETFSLANSKLIFQDNTFDCYIYYPHPETKTIHKQPETMLEIIAPKIENISYGSKVDLVVDINQVRIL